MMCESPKAPRTNDERPAIRQLNVPDAEPEPVKLTLNATCEIDAVPPPERWVVAAVALGAPSTATALATAAIKLSLLITGRGRQCGRRRRPRRVPEIGRASCRERV